ncbi:MAG: hypothetical protein ACK50J_15530 [Planctomyces sp.]
MADNRLQQLLFVGPVSCVDGSNISTLVQVTRITPRRGPPVNVFNFEVDVDHVYHVGHSSVLVHSACNPLRTNMIDAFGHPGAGWQAAHIIPKNG